MELIKEYNFEYWVNDKGYRNGEYKSWHDNGHLKRHCFFHNNQYHGEYKAWYRNGQIELHCFWGNDNLHGECKTWWENGELDENVFYADGVLVRDLIKEPADEEDKFMLTLKHGGQWLWN